MNEKDFLQKALNAYDNPSCISMDEFKSDLDRFSHIKKLFNKYQDGAGPSNERLVLNHLVICFNVFGDTTLDLAFFKIESNQWGILIPYLIFLNRLSDEYKINQSIPISNIVLDQYIISRLRELS